MTARIYTAAEAEALREAATPGPWRTYGNAAHDDAPSDVWSIAHDGITLAEAHSDDRPQYDEETAEVVEADADLMAAAPDLAASVAFHARRAERAEADLTVADDRARDAEAESVAAEAALVAVWQAVTDDDLPRLPTGDGTVVDAEAVGRRVAEVVAARDALRADVALWQRGAESRHADMVELRKSRDFWRDCEARQREATDAANAHAEELARALRSAQEELARQRDAFDAGSRLNGRLRNEVGMLARERDALRAIVEGRTTPPTDAEVAAHAAAGGRWRCVVPEALRMCADGMHGHAARLHRETLDAAGYTRSSWWATDASARPCAWPVVTEVTP